MGIPSVQNHQCHAELVSLKESFGQHLLQDSFKSYYRTFAADPEIPEDTYGKILKESFGQGNTRVLQRPQLVLLTLKTLENASFHLKSGDLPQILRFLKK